MTSSCRQVSADDPYRLLADLRAALAGTGPAVLPVRTEDAARVLAELDLSGPVAEATAAVVATSGSTGTPKAAMLSGQAMVASAEATLGALGGPGQWLLTLPVSSVAGLQVLTRSVVAGSVPVAAAGSAPAELARAVDNMTGDRRYGALVPTQLRRALADPASAAALARLDAVLLGAAAADAALLARAAAAGVHVITTYGMTETCGGCVYDGRPLGGVQVQLASDGRIQLAGPTLFTGYLGRPDLTAEVLQGGWLHTQDLGEFERDGRLAVLGRVDDMVISGGVNVALPRVAARLRAHPAVADAVCIGVPDPEWGTAVVAFTVGRAAGRVERDDVRDWVARGLGRHCVPRRVLPVPSLPMLANGKPDLTALRAWAEAASDDVGATDRRRSRT